MLGVKQRGAGAWSNMVKREEEEVVWKHEGSKCREWKWADVAAAGALVWQIYCEDYGRWRRGHTLCYVKWARQANEITVCTHKSKRKCARYVNLGLYITGP